MSTRPLGNSCWSIISQWVWGLGVRDWRWGDGNGRGGSRHLTVDGLVEGLGAAEADRAVEEDGGGVLGRHLEVRAAEAGLVEAFEGLADQGVAQPLTAVFGDHAQVLDRADRPAVHHPLDSAAVALGAADQPGRRGEEPGLAADLAHQALAARALAQAGEDVRVDLAAEALV